MKKVVMLVGIVLATNLSFVSRPHALSVGDIMVQSPLGAPFVAEVPLVMKPHERDKGFVVMIGDPEEYEDEGITRALVVDQLRPTVIVGPPDKIQIVSEEPIQVPTFDVVLLARAGQVTIVRHYPIMLSAAPSPAPVASAPATKQDTAVKSAKSAWVQQLPQRYGPVQSGDTLYGVVKALEVPKSVIWQVAVLVWQANQSRFSNGNMHGLRSGVYLQLPADLEQAMTTLSMGEARQVMAEQWEAWQPSQRVEVTGPDDAPPAQTLVQAETVNAETVQAAEEMAAAAPTIMWPTQELSSSASVTDIQSVLEGMENRLAQRLSLPSLTPAESADSTISLVSATELQNTLQGFETRLLQELQQTVLQQIRLEGASALLQPQQLASSLQQGIGSLVAPLFSINTILYMFVGQNILLFLLAGMCVWLWYRSRKARATAPTFHTRTQPTKFVPVMNEAVTE